MQYKQDLEENGVKIEDTIEIWPLFGRNKQFKLLYTEIQIESLLKYEPPQINGKTWLFPSISQEPYSLTLKCDLELNRFYLYSRKTYFKVNGHWIKKIYLKRGDCLQLFGNKIYFKQIESIEGTWNEISEVGRNLNVLIEGETGTGKTELAKRIHKKSGLKGEFIHLNISAFSKTLIESELFGHIEGAFTGAIKEKKGAVELAEEGTLFLDEIDSLSLDLQTKLLIFLDNGEFRKVGSPQLKKVKTRFLFASGRSLKTLVKNNQFRKDLYYRISTGFYFLLPPLRKNTRLIKDYIDKYEQKNDVTLDPALKVFYQRHTWPGNYRQLEGHLNRKKELTYSRSWVYDPLDEELLDELGDLSSDELQISELDKLEKNYTQRIYQRLDGDERKACEVLSISKYRLNKILQRVSSQ